MKFTAMAVIRSHFATKLFKLIKLSQNLLEGR